MIQGKIYNGVIVIIGFILSPLSWWNDLVIYLGLIIISNYFIIFCKVTFLLCHGDDILNLISTIKIIKFENFNITSIIEKY